MRLLLFFISLLFSFIFYIFHLLGLGLNIFGNKAFNQSYIESFSGNLLIESFVFFLIGIIFIFYFSPLNKEKKAEINKEKVSYYVFYILFLAMIYFGNFFYNKYILVIVLIFLFGDFCFNLISNLNFFSKQKDNLRYFGIILNYLSIIFGIYYLYIKDFSLFIVYILLFSLVFNFLVHKKYINYISLLFSIFISIFLVYFFFLEIYNLYIILF